MIRADNQELIVDKLLKGDLVAFQDGSVRRRSGKLVERTPNKYLRIEVKFADGRRSIAAIHNIIWIAFNGRIPDVYEVNHKDGVKTNNALSNLELVTRSENIRHAIDLGLKVAVRGDKHGRSKLSQAEVDEIRLRGSNAPLGVAAELAREFGISSRQIRRIIRGTSRQ